MDGRWSVRELEERARRANVNGASPRRLARPRALHPDQEAAALQIDDAFGAALGRQVEVTATAGGYRVHLSFESLEEALDLAHRLSRPRD